MNPEQQQLLDEIQKMIDSHGSATKKLFKAAKEDVTKLRAEVDKLRKKVKKLKK